MLTEKNLSLTSKSALEEEQERDLEVWRQAYNAALASDCDSACVRNCAVLADIALDDYRAKREELLG
jgi:hypothetical protein